MMPHFLVQNVLFRAGESEEMCQKVYILSSNDESGRDIYGKSPFKAAGRDLDDPMFIRTCRA